MRIVCAVVLGVILMTISAGQGAWASVADSQRTDTSAAIVESVPGLTAGVKASPTSTIAAGGISVNVRDSRGEGRATLSAPGRGYSRASGSTGSRYFDNTATDVDTAVQTLDGGARILEIIRSAHAPTAFTYNVQLAKGESVKQDADGSLYIGKSGSVGDRRTVEVTGVIGAPWARDAHGKSVPARYVVDGGTIRMLVEHSVSVAYQVVADPTYTRGGFRISWSIFRPHRVSVYMNKDRSDDAAASKTVLCIGIAFVPVAGVALAAICGISSILDGIVTRYGWCVKVTFNLVTRRAEWGYYRGGFCT